MITSYAPIVGMLCAINCYSVSAKEICAPLTKKVFTYLQQQSEAFSNNNACRVGTVEIKLGRLKNKHASCFQRNKVLDAENKGYLFAENEQCIGISKEYHHLHYQIEYYRNKKLACQLGASIITLKHFIQNNLPCLVKKQPTLTRQKAANP